MAFTSEDLARACLRALRMALEAARRHVSGCCSLAPGGSLGIRSYASLAVPSTFPLFASTTKALVDWVPLSTPITSVLIRNRPESDPRISGTYQSFRRQTGVRQDRSFQKREQ